MKNNQNTSLRGFQDIFDNDSLLFEYIEKILIEVSRQFSAERIYLPILEKTNLFIRNIGESSDIVKKEMYTFFDKKKRLVSLRPEGTVSTMRAVLQNKLYLKKKLPLKYYYFGPMFRYERPQSGRYRQFYQYGIEYIGTENYLYDVETILLANSILNKLKISNILLEINYLGSRLEIEKYSNEIKKYFTLYKDKLCLDCKNRLTSNVLRILDCKKDNKKLFFEKCPKLHDFLSSKSKSNFKTIQNILQSANINFTINSKLVRGLDYYSCLVYEFIDKKSSLTVIAGGRYNNISEELGGPKLSSIGFALGVKRLSELLILNNEDNNLSEKIYLYIKDNEINTKKIMIRTFLTLISLNKKVFSNFDYEISLKKILRKINKNNKFKYLIFSDSNYSNQNKILIKNLLTKEQKEININDLKDYF